jgi:hypothetical protein
LLVSCACNDLDDGLLQKAPILRGCHWRRYPKGSRAGGRTRMAQVTSWLCLERALQNPTRLAQPGPVLGRRLRPLF